MEGQVGYSFGRTGSLSWAVDTRVRLEDAELIGFELLQQIPDVLESERKYRMIADAQDLRRRLNRVQFEPMDLRVQLEQGLITVDPVEIVSDAMDVGVEGWHRLGGPMDFTLDFALRDLKSDEGEFGPVAEDGLGHRFFLAMRGTLEEPEFGYDRTAHKEHRRVERQGALDRLRGALRGEGVKKGVGMRSPLSPCPTLFHRIQVKLWCLRNGLNPQSSLTTMTMTSKANQDQSQL